MICDIHYYKGCIHTKAEKIPYFTQIDRLLMHLSHIYILFRTGRYFGHVLNFTKKQLFLQKLKFKVEENFITVARN